MSNIPAHKIVATKGANGTVFQLYIGAVPGTQQQLIFQWVMPTADTTALNTNVFGGSNGTSQTFAYGETTAGAQSQNQGAFNHWFPSV